MLKLHFFTFFCLELKKRCIFVSAKTNNNLNHKQMKVTEKQIFNAYLAVMVVLLFTYIFIASAIIHNLKPIF